jgi:chorismate synthase
MNQWGQIIKLSIFGESHGEAIGIIIGGLPPGISVDWSRIEKEMKRRAPGTGDYTTERKESDEVRVVSGLKDGRTTGAPLCGIIENKNTRSYDYGKILRPGHADWTALLKYEGYADMAGGGHFSGRLTAPLVFAGSLAKLMLEAQGIEIFGRIKSIGNLHDNIDTGSVRAGLAEKLLLRSIADRIFPAAVEMEPLFLELIANAKSDGDSVGGIVEAAAFGVPAGLGEPFFDSVESRLASLFFSVPAVKGVEFGAGFAISHMRGSEANDGIGADGGAIYSHTNNNGGVLGGITNGMPIVARVAIKPTASIALPQRSVHSETLEECELSVQGRHDPCIVPRAVPVIEACVALCLLDLLLEARR